MTRNDWPAGLTLKPIVAWPVAPTKRRERSMFSAPLSATLEVLTRELAAIKAKDVVMQIALEPEQFRNDGKPRAGAEPEHPGVILSMTTPDGALSFPCDTYVRWDENLRAIALTMERFRAIARYGVTKNGQQYAAFRALEAPRDSASFSTTTEAFEAIREVIGDPMPSTVGHDWPAWIRIAKRRTHPDSGGTAEGFNKVTAAEKYLREHDAI